MNVTEMDLHEILDYKLTLQWDVRPVGFEREREYSNVGSLPPMIRIPWHSQPCVFPPTLTRLGNF